MFYTENDYIAGKKLKLQRFGIQPIGLLKKLLIRIISIGFFFYKKKARLYLRHFSNTTLLYK